MDSLIRADRSLDGITSMPPFSRGKSDYSRKARLCQAVSAIFFRVGFRAGAKKPGDLVQMTGRTVCDRIVVFDGARSLAGTCQQIRITDATPFTLCGELVK